MPRFASFDDVMAYLRRVTNYERDAPPAHAASRAFNVHAMRALMKRLDAPHRAYPVIHVAGTKGKGSVCMMLDAMLRCKTGLYTSPHLVDLLERIQIDGRPISRDEFVRSMSRVVPSFRCTFFELMTAAAFEIFARRHVEAAVVEVGLGGRLDSTNIVEPRVCVINTIDYDHTAILGRTLPKIAFEKSGIIKRGVPVVLGPQRPSARRVILETARRLRAEVFEVRRVDGWRLVGDRLRVRFDDFMFSMPYAGPHQGVNAAIAIRAAQVFGMPFDVAALETLTLPGRFERRGRFILDVAHNPVSARALAVSLRAIGRRRLMIVFGASKDKDARSMLQTLRPFAREFLFTCARHPRAYDPADLARMVAAPSRVVPTVAECLNLTRGPTLVTGSFYVVGEALARLR